MGQVRKRGQVYWIRYYSAGRRIEASAETAKYDEARDLLRTKDGDISKGVPVKGASRWQPTVAASPAAHSPAARLPRGE